MESGPVWKWHTEHLEDSLERNGANFKGKGPGILRDIPRESLDELQKIFDVTGATERMETIDRYSRMKAEQLGMSMEEYYRHTFEYCSEGHFNDDQA